MPLQRQRPSGRPKDLPDYSLMVQAAQLYYGYDLTRGEIAERLNVQTRKVSELLDEAKQHGIVRITVQRDLNSEQELEINLKQEYSHLERALIVRSKITEDEKPQAVLKRMAEAAAEYLDELYNAKSGKPLHVAVTGGEGLLEFANAVPDIIRKELYVHVGALIGHGSLPEKQTHIDPGTVASILWSRSGRQAERYEFATVTPYDSKSPRPLPKALEIVNEELDKLRTNSLVMDVAARMHDIDVIFGGLGVVKVNASQEFKNLFTMEAYLANLVSTKSLYDAGARGDFCYCPFSATGDRIDGLSFFITPGHGFPKLWGVNFFKDMVANAKKTGKKVAGFVYGPEALSALKIALKARILNVVITDTETVKALLAEVS